MLVCMGFKKGISKCVECEKKLSEDPNETGMCSKCGSGARVDPEIHKELSDLGIIWKIRITRIITVNLHQSLQLDW